MVGADRLQGPFGGVGGLRAGSNGLGAPCFLLPFSHDEGSEIVSLVKPNSESLITAK